MNINQPDTETLWVKCTFYHQDVYLALCYFPPPTKESTFTCFIESLAQHAPLEQNPLLLIGDINVPHFGDPLYSDKGTVHQISTLMNLYALKSFNNIKNEKGRTLDICFSNFDDYQIGQKKLASITVEKEQGLVKPHSHHPPLVININLIKDPDQSSHNSIHNQQTPTTFNFK